MDNNEKPREEIAVEFMLQALKFLQIVPSSRENSLAITNLEQAMMWCNKDRTIKGQLPINPTHVEASVETTPAEVVVEPITTRATIEEAEVVNTGVGATITSPTII